MSSPPKTEDDNVAQSSPDEGIVEGDPGQNKDETAKDDIMDESHDIDVKEQDRWLPIANG
jgi:hypothetical protein